MIDSLENKRCRALEMGRMLDYGLQEFTDENAEDVGYLPTFFE